MTEHTEIKEPLSTKLRPVFAEAIHRHAVLAGHEAKYEWDLTAFALPRPDGNLGAVLLLNVFVPSPIIGRWISNTMLIQDPHLSNEEGIEKVVRQSFEILAQMRSKILADQNGH